MQNESAENSYASTQPEGVMNDTMAGVETPPLETESEEHSQIPETPATQFRQFAHDSQVGIMSAFTGSHATGYFVTYQSGGAGEQRQNLDALVSFAKLDPPSGTYRLLDAPILTMYSGGLLNERILLLSCHDENVVLNVARSIAYQTNIPSKDLVSIDETAQGRYNFRNFINSLGRLRGNHKRSPVTPTTICVWDATGTDEIANGILNSLLSRNSHIPEYKYWLAERGLCFICIVTPERVKEYKDSHSESLLSFEIDFLAPMLEYYDFDHTLAATIQQQRRDGRWSKDDAEFYREIIRHLKNRNLLGIVQERMKPEVPEAVTAEDLFTRQDPLIDTVLYCATYFPDLSPEDFFHLVELFLGEATEEVPKRVSRPVENGNEMVDVVESVPLVNRWRREAHMILRRCQLASVKNADDKRVIDFQSDFLRNRLSQFIPEFDPFYYNSNFVFVRQQGLLFSPKRAIAEGARQLLVDTGKQSHANEVANWLYEVVLEFEEMAQAADRVAEMRPLFHLLPDLKVKTARRYVAYGLSRVLTRCDKEPELREAVRLFWQKLLHNQHQWFLDLLRRMADSAPVESLKWLKQLLDQGTELIRRQARLYLVAYLLHRDSIYPALRDLMAWPKSTPSGRIARQALILYCAETNRQVAPQDYGQWPSLHPLFGFQNRSEAEECLDLLIGWIHGAASEVDADNAMYIIGDIVAGWYFILSSLSTDDTAQVAGEVGQSELNVHIVKDLLFDCLIRHSLRANALPEIWDRFKNDILDKIIELDAFINETSTFTSNADIVNDASTAKRKLLDTRAALSDLRHAYIKWVAQAAPAKDES